MPGSSTWDNRTKPMAGDVALVIDGPKNEHFDKRLLAVKTLEERRGDAPFGSGN